MDPAAAANNKNYEEKTQEMQLLISNVPQIAVTPIQNNSNGLLKPFEPIRARRSFCDNPDLTLSRRPSAVVTAIQQDRRTSTSTNLFLE